MAIRAKYSPKYRFLLLQIAFLLLMWVVFGVDFLMQFNLNHFAIWPRTAQGAVGILLFSLLHADINHILANSGPILVLLIAVRYIFPNLFLKVFVVSYVLPGIITWLIGRPAFHLGASGMIYALAVFMFLSGVIRANRYLLATSLLVVFLYGSLFWGLFPIEQSISWEGHLGGAITGFVLALWFRNQLPAPEVREPEPIWEDDDEDEGDDENAYWKLPNEQQNTHSTTEISVKYHYKPNDDKK